MWLDDWNAPDDVKEETREWYNNLPPSVREVVDDYPPIHIYRFKDSKKQFVIESYELDSDIGELTCTVHKIGRGGAMASIGFGFLDTNLVFGVKFDDIEFYSEI